MGSELARSAYLRRVDIRTFKSFGGTVTTLHFEPGFNVIAGPNGSGKSNIIDAIRFCLGENSPKALRVGRLSSLISDIGPEGAKPTRTRVTVQFDNAARSIPVDADTVTVTRELAQKGESIYQLNGKRVQKGTISQIFSLAMILPDGHNIVPQGMVTRASELTPDEKRKTIGGIVGVASFDEKKVEAERQLREAEVRLQVALARIGEIKSRIDALEGERNDQLRLRHLEEELRRMKAALVSKDLTLVRKKMKQQRSILDERTKALQELRLELDNLTGQIKALEGEKNAFISTVLDEAGVKHVEVEFDIAKASSEVDMLKATISDHEDTIKKIEGTLPTLYTMREEKGKEVEASRQLVKELEDRLEGNEELKKKSLKDLSLVQRKLTSLDKQISRANLRAERLHQRMAKSREAAEKVAAELAERDRLRSSLTEKLEALRDKASYFNETLKRLEGSLEELQRLRKSEQGSLEEVKTTLTSLLERKARLENEITKAVHTLEKAGDAVLRYESQRSIAESMVLEEFGLRKLKELSQDGALDGFFGSLEELIRYDRRYEPAVLACGGKWMKAAVVKDLATMLKVAELAKRLKLGRMMIIPNSEVLGTRRTSSPPFEGVMGTLSDFISADEHLKGVVNFIFGDTFLVTSHRTAFMVSSKGFRAVTSSGDLFEPKKVAFETGYLARLDAISALIHDEASISAVKDALKPLQKIMAKRRADLTQIEKRSKSLNERRVRKVLALERLATQLADVGVFTTRYRRLQGAILRRVHKLEKSLKGVEVQVQKHSSIYTAAMNRIRGWEEKLAKVNIPSMVAEERVLEDKKISLHRSIEGASLEIREVVTQLTKERAHLEHDLRAAVSRLKEQISTLEKEKKARTKSLEEARTSVEGLQHRLEELKEEEKRLLEAKKKARPILDDYEKRLKHLRSLQEARLRSTGSLDKELLSISKGLENLAEKEQRLLNEISSLGYSGPVEAFDGVEALLQQITSEYEDLKGRVNLLADRNYREIIMGYKNLSLRRNQLEQERNAIVNFIEGVEAEKKRVFMVAFEKIDRELRSIFSKLTGGSAWLEVENPSDLFSGGIFLMTQFPSKIPRESTSISGGEKTVTALAFLLAIQSVYPSPLYLFDEIDAHLDAVNVERLADLLRERSELSQIILVSLKPMMASRASLVYGVYNEDGASKVVRYRPGVEVVVRGA